MEEGLERVGKGHGGDGLKPVRRMPLPLLRLSESVRLTLTWSFSGVLT